MKEGQERVRRIENLFIASLPSRQETGLPCGTATGMAQRDSATSEGQLWLSMTCFLHISAFLNLYESVMFVPWVLLRYDCTIYSYDWVLCIMGPFVWKLGDTRRSREDLWFPWSVHWTLTHGMKSQTGALSANAGWISMLPLGFIALCISTGVC